MPNGERAVQAVMLMEMKRESKEEVRLRVLFFLAGLFFMHPLGCGARVFVGSIEANFTASPMNSVDAGWIFLASRNGTFNLKWYNPTGEHSFYLCVVHAQSEAVVWSANRGSPVSNSDDFVLTREGAVIQTSSGRILWSVKGSDVGSVQLRDDGNLVMLDLSQAQVWQSFDHPTDTLLPGQRLVLGSKLVSNTAEDNYSLGDYEVSLIQSDLALKWDVPGFDLQTYWSMAGDSRTVNLLSNSAFNVAYAAVDQSGLNLYSSSSSSFSMALQLPAAVADKTILRRAVIDPSGQFRILSFIGGRWLYDLEAVESKCRLPATCGPLEICLGLSNSLGFQCSCPMGFQMINQTDASEGCEAPDTPNCNSSYKDLLLKNAIAFVSVGDGVDYFAHEFQIPIKTSAMEDCERMCLKNCSCAAFFFLNTSGSCFLHGFVGSMISRGQILDQAYLKVIRSVNQKESESRIVPIVLGLAGAVTVVILVCLGLVLFCYRKNISNLSSKTAVKDPDDGDEVLLSIAGLPTRYSYADIRTATDNFAQKIGSGGFGVVYEGTLPDGTKVAVKKLDTLLGQGKKEFYSEIAIIGSIHHVNLVKLHGFCVEGSNRLLVYEHMSRGSLDRSLFGYPVLEWQERCDIALGTARGLAYLHEGCRQKIIHCDIKPENILLNEKLETKVSDFGLAKLLSREESQAFTTMRGTRGYLAPEWLTNASISDRTDVYSYGMLLLEIIGGRKNSFPSETGSHDHDTFDYFPTRALQLCEDRRFSEAADPRLEGRFCLEEVEKLVKIALCCLHEDSNQRPSMSKVVHMIEGNLAVEDPQVDSLMFLRIYARRINSTATLDLNLNLTPTNNTSDRSTVFTNSPSPSHANRSMISSAQLSGPR